MASLEGRGYAKRVEAKKSGGGKEFVTFDLAVPQKRKEKGGVEVKETLYWRCVDFSGGEAPKEGEYVGVTGYATFSQWSANGKTGINVDVTVKSYEKLPQRDNGPRPGSPGPAAGAPPADPWDL